MNQHLTDESVGDDPLHHYDMSTFEIIIVFSALMALIALVTIGIDWIGKPLKHRRFIPRVYRFDDEKLPVDAYGYPLLDSPTPNLFGQPLPTHPPSMVPAPAGVRPVDQPSPIVVATVPESTLTAASAPPAPAPPTPALPSHATPAGDNTVELQLEDDDVSTSAFSDRLLGPPTNTTPAVDDEAWSTSGLVPEPGMAANQSGESAASASHWEPGMALDVTVNDERPSLATKAERFWRATAAAFEESHFDPGTIDRMASGKAPRRRNPRSGRSENMQLTGLRRASTRSQVRMSWPDDSVDPWAGS